MHEMSIALNILEIVERTAQAHGADTIKSIFIDVGALAGVMIPALEFGLEIAKKDTAAGRASININEIKGQGDCPECGRIFPMGLPLESCPNCKNSYLRMIAGDELRVREIEVEKES